MAEKGEDVYTMTLFATKSVEQSHSKSLLGLELESDD